MKRPTGGWRRSASCAARWTATAATAPAATTGVPGVRRRGLRRLRFRGRSTTRPRLAVAAVKGIRGSSSMDFAQARRNMVDGQVRTFDVSHIPLLAALEEVPRERFVTPGRETLAYSDEALPVGEGAGGERRFMVKPMFLARLVQALAVEPGEKVLDVACGWTRRARNIGFTMKRSEERRVG